MTGFGFVTLLRLGEVRMALKMGIKILTRSLHQYDACYQIKDKVFVAPSLPHPQAVRGMQLIIGPRKTRQKHGSWITLSDPTICGLMMVHLHFLRAVGHSGKFLFPSRENVSGKWLPHPNNAMSRSSYIGLMRLALLHVCKIPWDVCLGYTGHTLRVGGNNFVRQTKGLSEDINRQLGDWASKVSCRSYNQLQVLEQMEMSFSGIVPTSKAAPEE